MGRFFVVFYPGTRQKIAVGTVYIIHLVCATHGKYHSQPSLTRQKGQQCVMSLSWWQKPKISSKTTVETSRRPQVTQQLSWSQHWGWHEGVAFGRLVASDWNFWWLLQQLQIVWTSDSLDSKRLCRKHCLYHRSKSFCCANTKETGRSNIDMDKHMAWTCNTLPRSWRIFSLICGLIHRLAVPQLLAALCVFFHLSWNYWSFTFTSLHLSSVSSCWILLPTAWLTFSIFFLWGEHLPQGLCRAEEDDAGWLCCSSDATRDLRRCTKARRLQVQTASDWNLGRTWKNLEKLGRTWKRVFDVRQHRAAQPQPLEIWTRFRARCKALAELLERYGNIQRQNKALQLLRTSSHHMPPFFGSWRLYMLHHWWITHPTHPFTGGGRYNGEDVGTACRGGNQQQQINGWEQVELIV